MLRWRRLVLGAIVVCMLCLIAIACITLYSRNSCSEAESIRYLDSLCRNYTNGFITGTLCKPLCDSREILFQRCLGHGVKLHVLEARWGERTVVLKTAKLLGTGLAVTMANGMIPGGFVERDFRVSAEQFVKGAESFLVLNQLQGTEHLDKRVLRDILRECDVGQDNSLAYTEALTCWQLVLTAEYVFYSLLRNNSAIPDLYGVCGNLYAIEYADSAPFLGFGTSVMDDRSWEVRRDLALALLDMVESLQDTVYGTLYLCDVQEPNFGVVRSKDGKLVVKAIDADLCEFEPSLLSLLEHERGMACHTDEDCFMVSCGSRCDKEAHQCEGVLTSSNLVTLCSRILTRRHRLHPALLRNPPHHIKSELNSLLEKCSVFGHSHLDRQLLNQLRHVLSYDQSSSKVR